MATSPIKHTTPPPPAEKPTPAVDEYYRSISDKFRIAKYISVISLVVFLIFSFTFLRGDITLENLRYLLKFISFTNTETSITATKINYASGDPNRLDTFIGDLCTLSPEGYALYDSRGNQIMAEDLNYSSPVLKTSRRYVLCYDMNGNSYTILNTFTKLYEGQTEYPITDADIADDGSFVIASSSREYRTAITLYSEDFTATSRIYKNDHLMAMELSPDGKQLALVTTGVSDGSFATTVELIVPGSDTANAKCYLDGLGYSFFFTDGGCIVVTDEGVNFLDSSLKPIRSCKHSAQLAMTHARGRYFTAVYSDGIIGNSYEAVIFDSLGSKVFEGELIGKLVGIDSDDSGDYVFILTGTTVTRINLINKKTSTITVAPDAIDLLSSSHDTVLAAMKNYALTYDFIGTEESYFERPNAASDETAARETQKVVHEETESVSTAEAAVPEETLSVQDSDTADTDMDTAEQE